MIFEAIVIAGSVWIGKRIYRELTTRPRPRVSTGPRTAAEGVAPDEEPLPKRELMDCRHFAVAASGLTLALGMLASPVLVLLTVPVLASGFIPLIRDGWRDLREKHRINYGLFVAMVTFGAIASAHIVLIAIFEVVYFGSEVVLSKTRRRARQTLKGMFDDWPAVVWVRCGESGAEQAVPLAELAVGDVVVVRAGESIPVDGIVVAGAGGVDQSMVTGESVVAETTLGDKVFAPTLLLTGTLEIRVERSGQETLAGEIAQVLDRMDSFEASVEHQGVEFADATVNPTIAVAALGWIARGPAVALTVAASNYADSNRLASPLSMFNYVLAMADNGIHVKDGRSLQLLGDVDTIVFDKTGTLTIDELNVFRIRTADDFDEHDILTLAAAAEERQQHPIAEAIRRAAEARNLRFVPGVTEANSLGNGIAARVNGSRVLVGSRRYMGYEEVAIPIDAEAAEDEALAAGQTVVHVAREQRWVGQIYLRSSVRPEMADVIADFQDAGYRIAILSGDHEGPTRRLAKTLRVDAWQAGVLPHEKSHFIEELQAKGHSVCFVGDGINDAMALKSANVSITLSGASMAATDAAQIVLQQRSLTKLPLLFELSKRYRSDDRTMRGITLMNSALSTGGAIFLGLPLAVVYSIYLATLIAEGVIATSPRWRRPETHRSHKSEVPLLGYEGLK